MRTLQTRREYNKLIFGFWLVFASDGTMRMTRTSPQVGRSERAMFIEAVVPLAVFKTAELRGTITVPDPGDAPVVIDVEAASEALKSAIGVDIDLRVEGPRVEEQ